MPSSVERTHRLRRGAQRLDAELRQGLRLGAMVVKAAAQEGAPELTGQMTRSVTISQPKWSGGRLVIYVGPGPESKAYSKYTELPRYIRLRPGLGPISRAKGARKPWLKPALEENRGAVMALIRGAVRKGLREMARSG